MHKFDFVNTSDVAIKSDKLFDQLFASDLSSNFFPVKV
jgi:hypothetical protein